MSRQSMQAQSALCAVINASDDSMICALTAFDALFITVGD